MLRRLLVVGLARAFLAVPALAHAGTVAIFYYPWYGDAARDGAWQHWNQNGHRPPADLYSRFYPAGGPYSSNDPAVVAADGGDRGGRRRRGRRLLVGPGLRGGRAAAARPPAARRPALLIGIHLEPYAGRRRRPSRRRRVPRRARGPRHLRLPPARHPGGRLGALRRSSRRACGSSPARSSSASPRPASSTASTPTTSSTTAQASSCACCEQAHAVHLLCAPSVGPGYDGVGQASRRLSGRRGRRDLRQPLDRGARGKA